MLPIVIPMLLFTLIVALLAAAVLGVRRRLTVRESVVIAINGQRQLEVMSGETLLTTLTSAGIQLPAACGGRGTCGQCRVTVVEGSGRLLPTEFSHINRRDAQSGARLACMLKVRGNLALSIPAGVLEARRWHCRVRSNRNITTYLTELILELPALEQVPFEAGDYVLVTAPGCTVEFARFEIDDAYRQEWQRHNLLGCRVDIPEPTTRAYSLANAPGEADILTLVVRIALPPASAPPDTPPGMVSSDIFGLKTGDNVDVSGPFGEFHVREGEREMLCIGGGAGIAPLRSMIRDQLIGKAAKRKLSFWYGSRNLRELVYQDEFAALASRHENFSYHVALSEPDISDAWEGHTGLIHNVVYQRYLMNHPAPESVDYYLCGPPLMSSAVLAMLEDLGVDRESVFFDDFGGTTTGKSP